MSDLAAGFSATTFFSRTYDDAFALLVAARDYITEGTRPPSDRPALSLVHSVETLRLTTRLTHIMAWLLVQRAVHAGEISREEARGERFRLDGREVCLEEGAENTAALPTRLRELLRDSRRLYQRVARLDEMVGRDIA